MVKTALVPVVIFHLVFAINKRPARFPVESHVLQCSQVVGLVTRQLMVLPLEVGEGEDPPEEVRRAHHLAPVLHKAGARVVEYFHGSRFNERELELLCSVVEARNDGLLD
jgi:hypothetical protein